MSRKFTAKAVKASYSPEEIDEMYEEYDKLDSKRVSDFDGFLTDYTMYQRLSDGMYIFVFGDNDRYTPDNSDVDFETESYDEAIEWFNDYDGYTEEE